MDGSWPADYARPPPRTVIDVTRRGPPATTGSDIACAGARHAGNAPKSGQIGRIFQILLTRYRDTHRVFSTKILVWVPGGNHGRDAVQAGQIFSRKGRKAA